jgi:hypothetical protein
MNKNYQFALECGDKLQKYFDGLKNTLVFGDLLSLTSASQNPSAAMLAGDLKTFLAELHAPAFEVLTTRWRQNGAWGGLGNALALLSSPSTTTVELHARRQRLSSAGSSLTTCGKNTFVIYRVRSLLCGGERFVTPVNPPEVAPADEEDTARRRVLGFLQDPIVRDQLASLVSWTGLVARPMDFWNGVNAVPLTMEEIAEGKAAQRGKDLIWGALQVLDVAIAQQVMLHGDLTALAVYDLAWDENTSAPRKIDTGKPTAPEQVALKLLGSDKNPWLSRNVLMLALDRSLRPIPGDISIPYESALRPFLDMDEPTKSPLGARDAQRARIGKKMLRSIFALPEDDGAIEFFVKDDGRPDQKAVRKIFVRWNGIAMEMPTPAALRDRSARGSLSALWSTRYSTG